MTTKHMSREDAEENAVIGTLLLMIFAGLLAWSFFWTGTWMVIIARFYFATGAILTALIVGDAVATRRHH